MNKNLIVTFFTVIFIGFIIAPTAITIMDGTIDTSIFYSMTEEEEKGSEKNKNIEVLFSHSNNYESNLSLYDSEHNLVYFSKNYTKPHLNLISPPPDLS